MGRTAAEHRLGFWEIQSQSERVRELRAPDNCAVGAGNGGPSLLPCRKAPLLECTLPESLQAPAGYIPRLGAATWGGTQAHLLGGPRPGLVPGARGGPEEDRKKGASQPPSSLGKR